MILLIHDEHSIEGTANFAVQEAKIAGEFVSTRHYVQEGKYVLVRNENRAVLEHDVHVLQYLGYRIATPPEQEAYAAMKRKRRQIAEKGN